MLTSFIACGIMFLVTHPTPEDWMYAAPLHVVMKKGVSERLVVDQKLTCNNVIKIGNTAIPTEDLMSLIGRKGFVLFSKEDGTQMYFQVRVDEASSPLTRQATDWKRVYRFNTLVMGSVNAQEWAKRFLDHVFQGMSNVFYDKDDIIIGHRGTSAAEVKRDMGAFYARSTN